MSPLTCIRLEHYKYHALDHSLFYRLLEKKKNNMLCLPVLYSFLMAQL